MTQAHPLWFNVFLGDHIAAGAASFLLAPVALATVKGGKQHRRWGMVYLYAMGVVAFTALVMAAWLPVLFLALVAVFSFYAAFSGYRILKLKDLPNGGKAKPIDWFAGVFTFCSSFCLALFAIIRPAWVQNFGVIAVVFGILGMRLAVQELRKFIWKPTVKRFWLYTHLGNFIGSYIAAWTAFSAVTLSQVLHGLGIVVWLWPTAIGVPAIFLTIGYYKRKYAGSDGKAVVAV